MWGLVNVDVVADVAGDSFEVCVKGSREVEGDASEAVFDLIDTGFPFWGHTGSRDPDVAAHAFAPLHEVGFGSVFGHYFVDGGFELGTHGSHGGLQLARGHVGFSQC